MDVRAQRLARRTSVRTGRSLLLTVTVLSVALLAACASGTRQHTSTQPGGRHSASQPTTTHPAKTVERTFTPFDASGRITVPVARTLSGHCWETSLAAPSAHSYRCLAGNLILDPCFTTGAHAPKAVCVADPWAKATVLRLTKPLPAGPMPRDVSRAWTLVLADRDGPLHCVAVTGTAAFVAGVGLPYACANGSYAAIRTPNADQVHAVVGRLHAKSLHTVRVTTIWRG